MQELLKKAMEEIEIDITIIQKDPCIKTRKRMYYSTCGKIWLIRNLKLIEHDQAIELINKAGTAIYQ